MKLYVKQTDEAKCPSCGWSATVLYVIAENEEEAERMFNEGMGMCGNCIAEFIAENGYRIIP